MRLFLIIVGLFGATAAAALGLAPTRFDLELNGSEPVSAALSIEGRTEGETLVDLSLVPRDTAIAGDEGALHLEVLPPQLVLAAGSRAQVRIVARASRPLGASRSFYLVAEHVGIPTAGVDGVHRVVDLVTRVHLPIHVASAGSPMVEVRIVNDGERRLLRIANHGRRYQRLSLLMLADDGPGALDGAALARRAATDAVLPGQTLFVPLEDGELPSGHAPVLTLEVAP